MFYDFIKCISIILFLQKSQVDPYETLASFYVIGSSSAFLHFARRLFSVSANSASCERLFSVFGNILTKLRNRTGNSTLTNLSELKMHIRDEHLAKGLLKLRLKRRSQAKSALLNVPAASYKETINTLESTINGEPQKIYRVNNLLILYSKQFSKNLHIFTAAIKSPCNRHQTLCSPLASSLI